MKYIRWLLGLFLVSLIIAAQEYAQRTPETAQTTSPQYERTPLEDRNYVFYTIQPGDTIEALTRKFRVTSEDAIVRLNPNIDPYNLPVNERIKIPLE